jgi:hypothetical protein
MVRSHNHRSTLSGMVCKSLFELRNCINIERCKGFVQHPKRRWAEPETSEGDSLLLARAQRVTGRLFEPLQPDCRKCIKQQLIINGALHPRRPSQILKRGQNFVNPHSVTEIKEVADEGFGCVVSRLSSPNNLSIIAVVEAAEDAQERCFTAAVAAGYLEHCATVDDKG